MKTTRSSKSAALLIVGIVGGACAAKLPPPPVQGAIGLDATGSGADTSALDALADAGSDAPQQADAAQVDVQADAAVDTPQQPEITPVDIAIGADSDTQQQPEITPVDGSTDADAGTPQPPDGDTADIEIDSGPDVAIQKCNPGGGGPFGCACQSNEQCEDSKACVDTQKGPQCAKLFLWGGCSGNEKKVAFGTGADLVEICVPKYPKLCNPCGWNAQCLSFGYSDAACVDHGDNGGFCGVGCATNGDCPAGHECAEVKDVTGKPTQQCVVKGGAACTCNEYAIQQQYATSCYKSGGAGGAKCAGKRTCLPAGAPNAPLNGGLTSCITPDPAPEECNGKDDDCDGQTDEATCIDQDPATGKENVCTDGVCQGAAGCKYLINTALCDADGSACTKGDACNDGKCKPGQVLVCDDKNECTIDSCDPKKGCMFANDDGVYCNADDNECTVSDKCKDGACTAGNTKACNVGELCLEGSCNPITAKCKYKAKDGGACNDGNACTANDVCKKLSELEGECKGVAVNCDDQNPCTTDSCDASKGCQHSALPAGSPCSAGKTCNGAGACQ